MLKTEYKTRLLTMVVLLPDSCWFVLKDSTLYRYSAPIDDLTENVIQLPGYTVTSVQSEPGSKLFILKLQHQVGSFLKFKILFQFI